MSTFTTPRTIQITLRHPRGSIRLATPTDVPLGELMPDFLDVAEQPDSDSWAISPGGANPYPNERTLAELGVTDGAMLLLYRRSTSPPSASRPIAHSALNHPWPRDRPTIAIRLTVAQTPDLRPAPHRRWPRRAPPTPNVP